MTASLPIRVSKPSDEMMEQVAGLLPGLPLCETVTVLHGKSWSEREKSHKGSGTVLRKALRRSLDENYAGHLADAVDALYFFEYIVDYHEEHDEATGSAGPRGLFVGTRLFAHEPPASAFHGALIYRIGDDQYLYWLLD